MGDTVSTYSDVERPGIYRCMTCDDAEQVLRIGEEAPLCDNCKRPVTWQYFRALSKRRIGF